MNNFPTDPFVKLAHNILFNHFGTEAKVETTATSHSSNLKTKLHTLKLARSLYTRNAMQIGAISGALLTFSVSLFCTKLHHIGPTITYHMCMTLCILIGYSLGMFSGAIFGRQISRNWNQDNHDV